EIKDQRSRLEVDKAGRRGLLVLAVDRRGDDDIGEGRSRADHIRTSAEGCSNRRVDELLGGRGRSHHLLLHNPPQLDVIALVLERRAELVLL
ncbi:hypothetical protein PENTCL1PPCAC_4246, partial [Pristionchus entomophagus]